MPRRRAACDRRTCRTTCWSILLGSRYCETDRLTQLAWSLFGNTPPGWPPVQAICDYVHDRIDFGYQHAGPTRTALAGHDEEQAACAAISPIWPSRCAAA